MPAFIILSGIVAFIWGLRRILKDAMHQMEVKEVREEMEAMPDLEAPVYTGGNGKAHGVKIVKEKIR